MKKDYNLKALNDVYKNAEIAINSIKVLLPSVNDAILKRELKEEKTGYQNIASDTSAYIIKHGNKLKKTNFVKKAMMNASIKMKLLFDSSRNHIASMMINGTVMGINELTAMKNEKKNLSDDVLAFVSNLLELEESYYERLKTFL